MRYRILKPTKPTDPRSLQLGSLAVLDAILSPIFECATEKECVKHLRSMCDGGVAMPVPVTIGSGQSYLLGFVEDEMAVRRVDPDQEIPFVLFVHPVAENDDDRRVIKAAGARLFDRKLWKVPVVCAELAKTYDVEIRASDAEVPVFTTARVGHHKGKLVIYAEAAGVELSIAFDDPNVRLTAT